MKQNKLKNNLILGLGSASLVVFLLTLAIAITIWSIALFTWVIDYYNIDQAVGLSQERILENYMVLMSYLNFPWISELNMPDFPSSASGAFHFYEVKLLFYLEYALLIIFAVIAIVFLRYLFKNKKVDKLKNIFKVLAFVPLVIIVLLFLFFDQIFLLFHEVLFDNDAWLFDPAQDPIIRVLPQEFFMLCFVEVFVILEAGLIGFYLLGRRYEKKYAELKN